MERRGRQGEDPLFVSVKKGENGKEGEKELVVMLVKEHHLIIH